MKAVLSVANYVELLNDGLRRLAAEEFVVEGEVVDFRISQGKWINFDLKDEQEEVKISCFATVYQISPDIQSGWRVQVSGYPKIFERFGKLSLNITELVPVGSGTLALAYLALKKRLEGEGLFALERKRALPEWPERIGLITSKEAAAYGDFLRILGNRQGGIEILHIPVQVQGAKAVAEICGAFKQLGELGEKDRPELIVLTRGGGSLEDLHAFNDEQVARAVFGSLVPVVVGVGHERDETLVDFVADVRASTPSNAAELISYDRAVELDGLSFLRSRFEERIRLTIVEAKGWVERRENLLEQAALKLTFKFKEFNQKIGAISILISNQITSLSNWVQGQIQLINSYAPERVLARGYAVVRRAGKVISDHGKLVVGEKLKIQLKSGEFLATVEGEAQSKLF